MNHRSRLLFPMPAVAAMLPLATLVTASLLPVISGHASAQDAQADQPVAEQASIQAGAQDAPLAEYQAALLDVAFESVSALPLDPQIKNRSRAQLDVIEACLELDQPARALEYVRDVANWRRGLGFASCAYYCARHDQSGGIEVYLDQALEIAAWPEEQIKQGWRRDRIRNKVIDAYVWMGDSERAAEVEALVQDESELGKAQIARASVADEAAFDELMAVVQQRTSETGDFEQIKNALLTCVQLFDRFYDDAQRRGLAEDRVHVSSAKLPLELRIELLSGLALAAVGHGDEARAMSLAAEAQTLFDSVQWTPDYQVRLGAQLLELRLMAGEDAAQVRKLAEALQHVYDGQREAIVDIDRAGVLRTLAELRNALGDREATLTLYLRALDEGQVNPNSRPRAEDLAATCCSMAVHAVEPDEQIAARMAEIHEGLGAPW